jgi:hypothetical protein
MENFICERVYIHIKKEMSNRVGKRDTRKKHPDIVELINNRDLQGLEICLLNTSYIDHADDVVIAAVELQDVPIMELIIVS